MILSLDNAQVTIPKKRLGQYLKSIQAKLKELDKKEKDFIKSKEQFLIDIEFYVNEVNVLLNVIKTFTQDYITTARIAKIDNPNEMTNILENHFVKENDKLFNNEGVLIKRFKHHRLDINEDDYDGFILQNDNISALFLSQSILSKQSYIRHMKYAKLEELESELYHVVLGYAKAYLEGKETPDFLNRIKSLYVLDTAPLREHLLDTEKKFSKLVKSSVDSLTIGLETFNQLEELRNQQINL